jgi:hypothetical protein
MAAMKDEAIVCNIGHFDRQNRRYSLAKCTWDGSNHRVDLHPLSFPGRQKKSRCWPRPPGQPQFAPQSTSTADELIVRNQVIPAQMELFTKGDGPGQGLRCQSISTEK